MSFAHRHAITDVCILVKDIDATVRFYTEMLGFSIKHRAPGFADFSGAGVTLACWERNHIAQHAGVKPGTGNASVAIAVKLDSEVEIDFAYAELSAKGVSFVSPPANYPWNARCLYFAGPDGEIWELYAWLPGGAPGRIEAAA